MAKKFRRSTRKPRDTRLHDAVVSECTQFYKYRRRARASDVAEMIRTDHPALYAEFAGQLADRQLRRMCAETMKSWQAVADEETGKQFYLLGFEPHFAERLPPALSIPVEGDKQDIEFVPLSVATMGECKQHLEYLRDTHKAIGLTIAAIMELIDRGDGCPPDVPLVQFIANRTPYPVASADENHPRP